jgi:putative tricarboxylic transport membrane protein
VAVWTRAESQITSTRDLLARLKKDPASVSFGISPARGNQNHIVLGMLASAAGVDPKLLKIVVFSSGGTGTTAALGGHVDVWAGTLGGALPNAESRIIRVLGISAEQRQPGRSAALPTFREQGIDAAYSAIRGVIAPGGLSAGQRAYWDQTFATMTRNPEWKKLQDEHAWGLDYRNSTETRKVLDTEYELLRKVLVDLGVTKANIGEGVVK